MDDDRTLLALVAAAAEIPCKGWCQPGARTDGWHGMYTGSEDDGAYKRWNPLIDDGDALRLAVKCFLVIDIGPVSVSVHENNGRRDIGFEWHDDDPNAATRRAIVRAAAALSKSP